MSNRTLPFTRWGSAPLTRHSTISNGPSKPLGTTMRMPSESGDARHQAVTPIIERAVTPITERIAAMQKRKTALCPRLVTQSRRSATSRICSLRVHAWMATGNKVRSPLRTKSRGRRSYATTRGSRIPVRCQLYRTCTVDSEADYELGPHSSGTGYVRPPA